MTAQNKPPDRSARATARRLLRPLWHSLTLYGWFWLPGIPPADLFDPPYPRDAGAPPPPPGPGPGPRT